MRVVEQGREYGVAAEAQMEARREGAWVEVGWAAVKAAQRAVGSVDNAISSAVVGERSRATRAEGPTWCAFVTMPAAPTGG